MTKNDPRKALGKGLHALLPARGTAAAASAPVVSPAPQNGVQTVPIKQVAPNADQPRRDFDAAKLMELTRSIEREGIIQPILVRKTGPADYQIIAGERRWRAAGTAGLTEVPVIVRTADDEQALELALVENIQREDLNPIELATAFHRMANELGLSHDQIGARTGKERTTITNAVRLLQLPGNIQNMISTRQLSAGHARALLKFEDPALQLDIANQCVAEGWSVRQIEEFTRKPAGERTAKTKTEVPLDPNVKFAVTELERVLGTRVRIVERGKGAGRIEIDYYNADDLSRIYDEIVGEVE